MLSGIIWMNKETEIIDISSFTRKMYLVWFVVGFLLLIIASYIFDMDKSIVFILMGLLVPSVLYGVEYFITKDKIVLNLGNILVSKHKEYFLSNGTKSIDKLRIRKELNYNEEQNREAFVEFLERNELYKYDKIYLTGSNSKDDIDLISSIINTNSKDAS